MCSARRQLLEVALLSFIPKEEEENKVKVCIIEQLPSISNLKNVEFICSASTFSVRKSLLTSENEFLRQRHEDLCKTPSPHL